MKKTTEVSLPTSFHLQSKTILSLTSAPRCQGPTHRECQECFPMCSQGGGQTPKGWPAKTPFLAPRMFVLQPLFQCSSANNHWKILCCGDGVETVLWSYFCFGGFSQRLRIWYFVNCKLTYTICPLELQLLQAVLKWFYLNYTWTLLSICFKV